MKLLQTLLLFMLIAMPATLQAQHLPLTDILQLYKLDSTAARQYCTGKQFGLAEARNTGSSARYQYAASDSSGARLEIRYPNDTASVNVQLNYWFVNAKEYAAFKTALKKQGFSREAVKDIPGSLPAHAEQYTNKTLQIELIDGSGKQPYWLFVHVVGGYTW